MALNPRKIVAEFEKRYTDSGQTMKDIKTKLFEASVTSAYFKMIPKNDDYHKSAYASIDKSLQTFGRDFVSASTATFEGWETKLGEFKIDDKIVPDELRETWMGFLVSIEEVERAKWPFLKWYIQQLLLPQAREDFEMKVAYWGMQMTGTASSAAVHKTNFTRTLSNSVTAERKANAAMDGIRTQIIKMVAANRAKVINTGALNTNVETFCGQIEAFVAAIPRPMRSKIDYLFMSEDLLNRYKDGRREKYNEYYKQEADLMGIKNSMIKVQSLPSMDGSQKIWCTPPANRVRPTRADNSGKFDVQTIDRLVKLLTDWKMCLAFNVPEFVFTNDQENVITDADVTRLYS